MISVLRQELAFNAHKQLIATLLFIVIGSIVLETLPLDLMIPPWEFTGCSARDTAYMPSAIRSC